MMRTKLYSILLFCTFSFATTEVLAQKKQFTIAEATNGMSTTLAPKSIKSASWQPGTDCFWQIDKKDSKDLYKVTDYSGKKTIEYYVEQGTFPEKVKPAAIQGVKWIDKDNAYIVSGKTYLKGILSADHKFNWNILATFPDNAENIKIDKSGKIVYTIDNNLWLWDKSKGNSKITSESNKDIVCGQAVHRNEFGIETGTFFSPKGNCVAYYRMDQSMVKDYPVIRWDTTPAMTNQVKYPMAGGTSHEVTLCIFNPALPNLVTIKTGNEEKDHYLTCVTWSPDEKYIFIGILNRDQNHLWLNKYDAQSGDFVKTIFEETNPKYVHPTHSLVFVPGKDDQFIWWSEKDGYEHLYLFNTSGQELKQLTKGEWVVNELLGFNIKTNKLIFTASKESPLEKHIYTVGLDGTGITRIDTEAGMHNAVCSDDGRFIFDVFNGPGVPKNSVMRQVGSNNFITLLKADNPLLEYDRPEIQNVAIKAADGVTTLYGKLILPTNFDKSKKYPVIVYLYNGPNVQLIHNGFPESGNLWYEYMAQHGFIVFTMDGSGSWNRGLAFEQATFRHLGDVEIEDQLKGVDYLKSLPFVDQSRIGVHGWSFGGFMTTSLMVKHPGVFKCAVAGGPVIDWKMYEVMYTERYMDKPSDNPEGYANANLLDKAKNLKGKLMLIHGTNDDVVVWQHSIDFIKKAVDEGVQVDYFVYPGHEHNVRGKDRVHLMQKISDYFIQNL